MIRRIELINFMSHRRTLIELAAGLTVLVGPNNCGKSAVVSALQILCENVRGDYMVRHGEDECRILVETDDGHTIEWRRIKGTQSYCVDGEQVHRLQGGVPDNLHDLLRLPKVRSSDEGHEFNIHFGEQKDPIFLVNQPGSRAATFFASSSDASRLVEMQQLHRKKGQQARRDEKRWTEEVTDTEARIARLTPALALEKKVEQAEHDRQEIVDLTERLKAQRQAQENIRLSLWALTILDAEVTALQQISAPPELAGTSVMEHLIRDIRETRNRRVCEIDRADALKTLADPPILQPIEPLEELIEALACMEEQRVVQEAVKRAMQPLASPPTLEETTTVEMTIDHLKAASNAVDRTQIPVDVLADIAEPPKLADVEALESLLEQLHNAQDHRQGLESASGLLGVLVEPPRPADDTALVDLIRCMEDMKDNVDNLDEQSKTTGRELAKAEGALREWVSTDGVCPTCGAQLDPDRVVEMAASGLGGHNHG